MYKNFNITESEKEQILNRLKENGYGQPINEQKAPIKKPVTKQPVPNVPAPLKLDNGEVVKMPFLKDQQTLEQFIRINSTDMEAIGIPAGSWIKGSLKMQDDALTNFRQKYGSNPEEESNIRAEIFNNSFYQIMSMVFNSVLKWAAAMNLNGNRLSKSSKDVLLSGIKYNDNSNWKDRHGRSISDLLKIYFDNNIVSVSENLMKWCCDIIDYKIKQFGGDQTQQPVQGQPTTTQPEKPLNEGQEILKDVFGKLINEQKVKPIQKPVVNPELSKKWETLKELTNNLISQVPAYVSKTLPNMIISNSFGENDGYHQQSLLQYRSVTVGTLTFNTTNNQVVHGKLVYSIEDRNLSDRQDVNQFAQDINKTMPSNINVYPTGYGTYNYGITFMYSMKEMENATKLKLFQQIDPNAGNQIIADLKQEVARAYKPTDSNYRKELYSLLNDLGKIMGTTPTQGQQQPVQGQQPQQQKPLNEGQEILKDVFKSLLK